MSDELSKYLDLLRAEILDTEQIISLLEEDLENCEPNRQALYEKMLKYSKKTLNALIVEENDYIKTLGFNDL